MFAIVFECSSGQKSKILGMLIEYKAFFVDLTYSASTKSYYGEIEGIEQNIVFQATSRQHAVQIMRHVVDEYLSGLGNFVALEDVIL